MSAHTAVILLFTYLDTVFPSDFLLSLSLSQALSQSVTHPQFLSPHGFGHRSAHASIKLLPRAVQGFMGLAGNCWPSRMLLLERSQVLSLSLTVSGVSGYGTSCSSWCQLWFLSCFTLPQTAVPVLVHLALCSGLGSLAVCLQL